MMEGTEFKIRPYTWKELGLLYSPKLTPQSAARRLKRWVTRNEEVVKKLTELNWNPTDRILAPCHVRVIVNFLDVP